MRVENLSKAYGDRVLFSEVSFHLEKGERCVLAGRNGSGKSTLLKILSGVEEPDSGEIHFPKGTRIGALPQHLHFNEPTVLEEAVLGLPTHQRDEVYRAEIILSGLGFSEENFHKPPGSFSGGYQLRLALTKVLVGEPDLLLLDEPTNYLDILAIRWLENFLRSWQGQILFVSHDRSFVNRVCTHVMGIKRGQVKKIKGNLEDYNTLIAVAEEAYERTREKQEKKKAHMMSFVERFGAKATKATQAQSRLKAIEKMEELEALEAEQNLAFRFNEKEIHNRKMMEAADLEFSYVAADPLIEGISLEVLKGDHIAIIGKNGSGKSTLLKLFYGELIPQKGSIEICPNAALGYFGQTNIDRLDSGKTIEEELMHTFPDLPYGRIRAACGAMLFSGDDAKKKISVLSGGERSRVLLAKLLLTPSNFLMLDEPTHHLDIESVEALMHAIKQFTGSVLLVTHDEDVLRTFKPSKLLVCHSRHQEIFLGDYDQFLETEGWEEEGGVPKKKPRKEDRQERALTVQQRAKELKPIRQKIEKLEKKIEESEKELQHLQTAMMNASQSEIAEMVKKHGRIEKDLTSFYEELEELLSQEEQIKNA